MKISPKLPLSISEQDGAYKSVETYPELINQNLRVLILTSPGEKVMDPEYGVGLRRYLFENQFIGDEINSRIATQIERYLPYIDIISLVSFVDDNLLTIKLQYDIVPLGINSIFNFNTRF